MPEEGSKLVMAFCSGQLAGSAFHHRDHVEVAFEMLSRHSFLGCAGLYAKGVKKIAAKRDRSALYNETITVAFLSLIAEAQATGRYRSFGEFARSEPRLMEKTVLDDWYSSARINSPAARRVFLLPDRTGRPA